MRSIRLYLTVPDQPASAVFTTLAEAGHVDVSGLGGASLVAHWDLSAPELRASDTAARFDGTWSCVDDGNDTALSFAAWLDLGLASPTSEAEPLAAATLVRDTVATVSGLFQGRVRVDDVVIQAHEPATRPAA